jgi:hypothetical protein
LQLEDIISLEKLEVSFIIYIGKFGSKDSHWRTIILEKCLMIFYLFCHDKFAHNPQFILNWKVKSILQII